MWIIGSPVRLSCYRYRRSEIHPECHAEPKRARYIRSTSRDPYRSIRRHCKQVYFIIFIFSISYCYPSRAIESGIDHRRAHYARQLTEIFRRKPVVRGEALVSERSLSRFIAGQLHLRLAEMKVQKTDEIYFILFLFSFNIYSFFFFHHEPSIIIEDFLETVDRLRAGAAGPRSDAARKSGSFWRSRSRRDSSSYPTARLIEDSPMIDG